MNFCLSSFWLRLQKVDIPYYEKLTIHVINANFKKLVLIFLFKHVNSKHLTRTFRKFALILFALLKCFVVFYNKVSPKRGGGGGGGGELCRMGLYLVISPPYFTACFVFTLLENAPSDLNYN